MYYSSPIWNHSEASPEYSGISPRNDRPGGWHDATRKDQEDPAPKRLAVPQRGVPLRDDDVFDIVLVGARYGQQTSVICLTDVILAYWKDRLAMREAPIPGLAIVDGRSGWSGQWRAFFIAHGFDLVILHGLHEALLHEYLPLAYAERIVSAVPSGLIVIA